MRVKDFEECLIEKVNFQDVESDSNVIISSEEWCRLKSNFKPGDELWSFSTLRDTKGIVTVLADGYVIKRGDLLEDCYYTVHYF